MPLLLLLLGVFACSTSVLWIKFSQIDAVTLTALRLSLAALLLSPLAYRDWRKHRDRMTWAHLRDAAIPGVVLVAHLVLWNTGARMTLASNGSLIVNLTPLVTPFLLWALMEERVNRSEIVATLITMVGLTILFSADYHLAPEHLRGDLVCFASMLLLSVYLVLGRKFRHHPTNLLFVVPMFATAGLGAFFLSMLGGGPGPVDWRAEAPWLALLVLLPTIFGHSMILRSMRHFRGQVVSVVNMTQFASAGLLAWRLLGERPSQAFYLAAPLILAAGALVALGSTDQAAPEESKQIDAPELADA